MFILIKTPDIYLVKDDMVFRKLVLLFMDFEAQKVGNNV